MQPAIFEDKFKYFRIECRILLKEDKKALIRLIPHYYNKGKYRPKLEN